MTQMKRNLKTVKDLASEGPFGENTWRWWIFNAPANGLAAALVRVGRRVYVDVDAFDRWLEVQNQQKPDAVVLAAPAASVDRFVDNGDGTVIDSQSQLMWSKDDVTPKSVRHAAAEKACAELRLAGQADWRLPTRAELLTLVDDTRHEPAINVEAFPSCKSGWYWTSTITAWSSGCAWVVDFYHGGAGNSRRDGYDGFVRAVRSVPAGQ